MCCASHVPKFGDPGCGWAGLVWKPTDRVEKSRREHTPLIMSPSFLGDTSCREVPSKEGDPAVFRMDRCATPRSRGRLQAREQTIFLDVPAAVTTTSGSAFIITRTASGRQHQTISTREVITGAVVSNGPQTCTRDSNLVHLD